MSENNVGACEEVQQDGGFRLRGGGWDKKGGSVATSWGMNV